MSSYPVPFRISVLEIPDIGSVEVVTSQFQLYGGAVSFETYLFWGNNGASKLVNTTINRSAAEKSHYYWAQPHVIIKKILKKGK